MDPSFIITSPNSQFSQMARSVCEEFPFQALIIEAILEEAVEQVLTVCRKGEVSAIISRGGTAAMIKGRLDIPVLVAEASDFDILSSLMEATAISSKIAYVLSADVSVEELSRVSERFKIEMKPFFFGHGAELAAAVEAARREGFRVVVSGSDQARKICQAHGLPCVLVNTSRRTMVELVNRAVFIQELRDRETAHRQRLATTINLLPESVFYLDERDRISLLNRPGLELLDLPDEAGLLDRPLSDFIAAPVLCQVLGERKAQNGRVLDLAGQTMLLHSSPVFSRNKYLGTVLSLQKAAEVEKMEHRVRREVHSYGPGAGSSFEEMEALAGAPAMRACLKRARSYAQSSGTILITGESGTGKELLAQSIHNASARRGEAFVSVNCAALPLNLLESELFGYEEGAFTGARRGGKPGSFELAHGGTLFLDELGLLPPHVQMQLLRVLQAKEVLRVGGRKMIPVDVRVLAATNADLGRAVAGGAFRRDLYYRLNVLRLEVPPLRERPEDIPLLIKKYLPLFSRENARRVGDLEPDLIRAFQRHDWPGNVRELLNYLMRLVVSADSPRLGLKDLEAAEIRLSGPDLPTGPDPKPAAEDDGERLCLAPASLDSLEEEIIRWRMRAHKGNRLKVCRELGLSRTTLWKKLKKIGLEDAGA